MPSGHMPNKHPKKYKDITDPHFLPSQVTRPQEEIDEEMEKGNKRPKKYKEITERSNHHMLYLSGHTPPRGD